ncbi:aspartyl protease family protein 1-like [Quillaja saponaria]|uniref:Aspartyl protease family protein 1-like n=1 Tax=Quillaja saponaria TaxID=32244 RepID=A0AAD7KQZ8_QUISA|nr:aspartyl protease family protein 1-like [Quillaja saponaria]
MGWSCSSSYRHSSFCILLVLLLSLGWHCCYGFRTFGLDIHHRFSDPVKGILAVDDLPEKGTLEYYVAMTQRDQVIRGRHLASADDLTPLAFAYGNDTYRFNSLGHLHYANVSVGTPTESFLVALDTGSDLFWLPCNCTSCVHQLGTTTGEKIEFNIYSPEASSTSKKVLCNSTFCQQQRQCPSATSTCPYQVRYLSNGTSSTGVLVEDVLHLTTDDPRSKSVDAHITFGCGQVQTGSFLENAAPNGLFGLGISNISVPSILAQKGLTSNSFSMCFGSDGVGRIRFGDNGRSDQGKTPFNLVESHPTYNISITQIGVGGTVSDLEFSAIFDSGTSFTYLNDPAYTLFTQTFNSKAKEKRHSSKDSPFEYSQIKLALDVPVVNLTMKGGDQYYVTDPIVYVSIVVVGNLYCLGIVKSDDVNIIGQNFMTGYRVVFDRDNMVLGWKESNCYDDEFSNTLPINRSHSPAISPALAVNPEATSNQSSIAGTTPPNHSHNLAPFTFAFIMALVPLFVIV